MKRRFPVHWLLLSVLVLLTSLVRAQDGLSGALSQNDSFSHPFENHFGQRLIVADFDSDQKPDGAVLLQTGRTDGYSSFRIDVHVTAGKNNALTFSSTDTELSVSVQDVNQDGVPDIVVEKTFTHQRLQVWINDGNGSFRKVRNEDYPANDQQSTGWRRRSLAQNPFALFFPARLGFDVASQQSTRLTDTDDSTGRNSRPRAAQPQAGLRAASASRAPPSFLSL